MFEQGFELDSKTGATHKEENSHWEMTTHFPHLSGRNQAVTLLQSRFVQPGQAVVVHYQV
ncbi:hypothetical protein GCM10026988_18480 [Vibrio panuliri]